MPLSRCRAIIFDLGNLKMMSPLCYNAHYVCILCIYPDETLVPTIQINEWAVLATTKLILTLLTQDEITASGGGDKISSIYIKLLLENNISPGTFTATNWRTSLWIRAIWNSLSSDDHSQLSPFVINKTSSTETSSTSSSSSSGPSKRAVRSALDIVLAQHNDNAHSFKDAYVSRILSIGRIAHDYWFEYRLKYFRFPVSVTELMKRLISKGFKIVLLTNGHEDIQYPKLVSL
jgi:hypothetical protein